MNLAVLYPRAAAGERARRSPSGGDLYDQQLTAALVRRGHRVELWPTAPGIDPRKLARELSDRELHAVIEDELGHVAYLALNRRLPAQLRRVALVHVTSARLAPEAQSVARERAFLESVDAAVFVSRQARRETERLLSVRPRSRVVHPGADHLPPRARAQASRPSTVTRFICVGHLLPHKGQLELLEALRAVEGLWSLALVGDDSLDRRYAQRVRRAAESFGGTRVKLTGALSPARLTGALGRADVFVSASAYESYGIAAAEALTHGVPVVAWGEGGLWEFLEPEENALRVKPGDRAGFSRSLQRLCNEPTLRRSLAAGARATRLPSWNDAALEVERLLKGLGRPVSR